MAKPRIANIIDDSHMGGIVRVLNLMESSELGQQFEFDIVTMDSRSMIPRRMPHDVLVVHYTASWRKLPHLAMLRAMHPQTSLIIQEHSYSAGFENNCVPETARFHRMLRLAYGIADHVIANSHAVAEWMRSAHLVSEQRLTTIPQCWDVSGLMDLPPPLGGQGCRLTLGAWGRFHHQKGFDDLIAAMARVSPMDFRLRIGGMGEDEAMLRALAKHLPHVEFVGQVTDLKGFLAGCDAVVIPSRWEPFGLVCLEAKAAARPMVVTRIDGLVEQAEDCAIMVEPGDIGGLAAAIRRLHDSDLRGMGLAGRQDATQAWPKFVRQWRDQLSTLTSDDGCEIGRFRAIPTTNSPGQNR